MPKFEIVSYQSVMCSTEELDINALDKRKNEECDISDYQKCIQMMFIKVFELQKKRNSQDHWKRFSRK